MRYRLSFQKGLEVLEGALAIGRQADLLAPEEVTTRMNFVQRSAATAASVPDKSLFSTIGMWLTPMH